MKISKLLLILTVLTCISVAAEAQNRHFDFTHKTGKSKVYYKITDKKLLTAEVTCKDNEYGSYKGNVTIADSVRFRGKTYLITSIGDSAFFGCEELDTVTFSNTIKHVGRNAFSLTNIRHINLNEGLEEIESEAFASCNKIKEFTVSKNLKKIGNFVFDNSGLQKLTIECEEISSEKAFNNITTLTEIIVAENVRTMPYDIFSGCDNISSLYYNAHKFNGFSPFEGLANLSKVEIGENVAVIPENFIRSCVGVTNINLPKSVNTIGSFAFSNTSIKEIAVDDGINEMGIGVFKDCLQLEYVDLPNSFAIRPDITFENCEKLYEFTIPDNLAEIDSSAFAFCKSLPAFVFPNTMKLVGKRAFDGCISLKEYVVESNTPPILEGELFATANTEVNIDCNAVLTYKNTEYWEKLNYSCDMDNITVQSSSQRDVFDKKRGRSFTERILSTGELSFVITNERNKTVSLVEDEISFRDNITRHIDIPEHISDGEFVYTVTEIEGLGTCRSVFIPSTVKDIDTMVFGGIDLQDIEVDAENLHFASSDGVLYSKDMRVLIAYPPAKAEESGRRGEIVLPSQTTVIGYGAFSNCKNARVVIGNNINSIGAGQDIEQFIIDSDNEKFFSGGQVVYNKDKSKIHTAVRNYTPKNRVLTINESISSIDDKAFYTAKFDTLKVLAKIPPEIRQNTFNLEKIFVCVIPNGSLNAYKNEYFWQNMNLTEDKPVKAVKKSKNRKKKK